jgi:hypothetical protein
VSELSDSFADVITRQQRSDDGNSVSTGSTNVARSFARDSSNSQHRDGRLAAGVGQ